MGKCPPSLPISYSLDHVTEKMLEKSINFIPLWKRMWHHNGSLWCTPVFWPPSFLLLRVLSCKQITGRYPCVSTLPNLNTHLRHIILEVGSNLVFTPSIYQCTPEWCILFCCTFWRIGDIQCILCPSFPAS